MVRLSMLALLFVIGCGSLAAQSDQAADTTKRSGEPDIIHVRETDAEMDAAIKKARETVADFTKVLSDPKNIPPVCGVKVKIVDGANVEHIWANKVTFDGKQFTGIIDNEPDTVETVRYGDKVSVKPEEISDWMYVTPQSKIIGAFTLRVLRKRMSPEERKEFDESIGAQLE
jgi:uncharacterized protein YegJ (DUF2314 family)